MGEVTSTAIAHLALLLGMMHRHMPFDSAFRVRAVGTMSMTDGTLGSSADSGLRYGSSDGS